MSGSVARPLDSREGVPARPGPGAARAGARGRLPAVDLPRLRALLWLRRRISRNRWARLGTLGRIISLLFPIAGTIVAAGGFALGVFVGSLPIDPGREWELLLFSDWVVGAFLFFWVGFTLIDVQRSETIDAAKLLHLPVTPGQVFLLNYLAAWLTPMLVIAAPMLLGAAVGLAIARGAAQLWLVPLVIGFLAIVTSFTYWLRGWLAGLMADPRRRRSIVVGIAMTVMLLGQLPNLWFNVIERPGRRSGPVALEIHEERGGNLRPGESPNARRSRERLLGTGSRVAHTVVPLLWLPHGAHALAGGNALPAVLGSAGSFALAAWALRRAHRSTLAAYLGVERGRRRATPSTAAAATAPAAAGTGKRLIERSFPLVSGQTSAIAVATLRAHLRAPETRMGLVMPVVMLVCFGAMALRTHGMSPTLETLLPGLLSVGLLFGWLHFAVNPFGFDRNGFRALLLAPVPRRRILIAKNLALLVPSAVLQVAIASLLVALGRHELELVVAAAVQFLTGLAILCIIGNWAAVAAPYRVSHGTMRRPKLSRTAVLVGFAIVLTFPLTMFPALLPSFIAAADRHYGLLPGVPLVLLSSVVLLCATLLAYLALLGPLARELERREREVLDVVTHDVE